MIIGIGAPCPSFIEKRLNALIASQLQLTIVTEGEIDAIKGAKIVKVGKGFVGLVRTVFSIVFNPSLFLKAWGLRPELPLESRIKWSMKATLIAALPQPDIVHFQWLTNANEYAWLRHFFNCPFIGSARGSQLTVYPITRDGYKEKLLKAIQCVDYIHCVSNSMMDACVKLRAPQEKLFLNYNGVNISHFRRCSDNRNSETDFVLISNGALIWRKGYLFQLIVLSELLKRFDHVRLIWIGNGPDLEGLKYLAYRMGCVDFVEFAGSVEHSVIPKWLSLADVYLSTSAAEGLSNGMVEAAACSLPIVSFECEGVNEVVENGYNGFVVKYGDTEDMIAKIGGLIEDKDQCLQMGSNSRLLAETQFDERLHVSRMIDMFSRISSRTKTAQDAKLQSV